MISTEGGYFSWKVHILKRAKILWKNLIKNCFLFMDLWYNVIVSVKDTPASDAGF